jgi:hypothetical protein
MIAPQHHLRLCATVAELWFEHDPNRSEEKSFYRSIFPELSDEKFRKLMVLAKSATLNNPLHEHESFIYIMSHPSMPGVLKIGHSETPLLRAENLSKILGLSGDFVVEKHFRTYTPHWIEHLIHRDLEPYRVTRRREFFEISVDQAAEAIEYRIGHGLEVTQ